MSRKGLLLLLGLVAWAGTAEARTEIVRWTHPDPSTVDEFRIYAAPGNVALDLAGAQVVDVGLPAPTAGVYQYALTSPDSDTVWVTVAAANAAGQGPLATPQLRRAPGVTPPHTPSPAPTPSPKSPPIGSAPSVGTTTTNEGPGATWSLLTTGDFDGDGRDELLWQNGARRQLWKMDGGEVRDREDLQQISSKWRIVGPGDFDADYDADSRAV